MMGGNMIVSRLRFLDGIRGVLALYVFLFHLSGILLTIMAHYTDSLSQRALSLSSYFHYFFLDGGRYAVVSFLVISGFCLALPVVRKENGLANFSLQEFLKRRAYRILPPYYIALLLSIGISLFGMHGNIFADPTVGGYIALTIGHAWPHFFLLQNLISHYAYYIDGPLWSVCAEFHIYLLFGIIIIPLWRKIGLSKTFFIVSISSTALQLILKPDDMLVKSVFWFSIVFLLGVILAKKYVEGVLSKLSSRLSLTLSLLLGGIVLAMQWITLSQKLQHQAFFAMFTYTPQPVRDILWALATVFIIAYCLQGESRLTQLLQSRPLAGLGDASYTLYLVHMPLLHLVRYHMPMDMKTGVAAAFLYTLLSFLLVAGATYGFYRLVERRFLNTPRASLPSS
jgi:peptidoglycan/LPS O-acetylase OafA/YrhL